MKFGLSVVFGVLTLVAVIGLLVFIVVTIVAKIKKRSVKKYLLTAVGCFVAMGVFSLISSTLYSGTKQQIEADAKKAQETVEKEKQQDKKEEQAKDKEIDEPIKRKKLQLMNTPTYFSLIWQTSRRNTTANRLGPWFKSNIVSARAKTPKSEVNQQILI